MSTFSQLEGISFANETSQVQRKKGASELGQEDFMKLLVAQMENQDPTKPMDNFQFLSQIAQFGTVDGIGKLQESMSSLGDGYRQGQILQASSMLEHEVLGSGNRFSFGGDVSAKGVVDAPPGAQGVIVDVRTAAGQLVDSISLGSGSGPMEFAWSGATADGGLAPAGQYTFHARGFASGTIQELSVNAFNRVDSVAVDDASLVELTLDTGEQVSLSAVKEIR